jgi:hypothetical protein
MSMPSLRSLEKRTPWSDRSPGRRMLSEALGEELEYWFRGKIRQGYTDEQIRDMLIDIGDVTLSISTVVQWRKGLGIRKDKAKPRKVE